MPFGPTQNETLLLLHLPFAISLVLALCLLVGRFSALVGAVIAFILYISIATSALGSIVGALMLTFSGWAAVVFLTVALFLSTREPQAQSTAPQRGFNAVDPEKLKGPPGKCPNCDQTIPVTSSECPYCGANFTKGAAWKVEPL